LFFAGPPSAPVRLRYRRPGLRSADPADRVIVSVRLTLDLTTFALSV
jgi:hypothetical protein